MSVPFASRPSYGAIAALRNVTFAFLVALLALANPSFAAKVTILALGDSLTAGFGLPPEQGFVPQLQAWLAGQGRDAAVVNGGVSGDTTAGGLARLDWSLTPDIGAMIVNLGGNDLLRGLDPGQAEANLNKILATAQTRHLPVLLVGLKALNNYGPDYKQAFDAIYPGLAKKYGTLFVDDYFAPLKADPAGLAANLQADGIHPNAQAVITIVKAMGPTVLKLLDEVPK